jgi:hypothetical protein
MSEGIPSFKNLNLYLMTYPKEDYYGDPRFGT